MHVGEERVITEKDEKNLGLTYILKQYICLLPSPEGERTSEACRGGQKGWWKLWDSKAWLVKYMILAVPARASWAGLAPEQEEVHQTHPVKSPWGEGSSCRDSGLLWRLASRGNEQWPILSFACNGVGMTDLMEISNGKLCLEGKSRQVREIPLSNPYQTCWSNFALVWGFLSYNSAKNSELSSIYTRI